MAKLPSRSPKSTEGRLGAAPTATVCLPRRAPQTQCTIVLLLTAPSLAAMADSEKKGFSLRKRVRRSKDQHQMPKISAPQQLQKPPLSSGPAGSSSVISARPRPRASQDQTANLIKKRLSHRYAGPNDVGNKDVPPLPVPAMPAMPMQFQQPKGNRDASPGKRGPQPVDTRDLMNPNLAVDQCKALIYNQRCHANQPQTSRCTWLMLESKIWTSSHIASKRCGGEQLWSCNRSLPATETNSSK